MGFRLYCALHQLPARQELSIVIPNGVCGVRNPSLLPARRLFFSRLLQFFTTSPTFAGPDPENDAVAESASTSVTVASPTLSSTDLITFPVAGSLITRTCLVTFSLSPTFTPAFDPTFMMMVVPLTSATKPLTSSLTVGTLPAEESS